MRKQKLELIISLLLHLLSSNVAVGVNPFTAKAQAIRYWNNKIYKVPRPEFLLSKASPLSPPDLALFSSLASSSPLSLSSRLPSLCRSANLFCFPDPTPLSSSAAQDGGPSAFSLYSDRNFTNYATGSPGGASSFSNYSSNENLPSDSFRRYGRDSAGHDEAFSSYAAAGNVVSEAFNTYAASATGGASRFDSYADGVNQPGLQFTSYSDKANGRSAGFSSYSPEANAGDQRFANYGKAGNGLGNLFKEYGKDGNVVGTGFSGYSQGANSGADNFTGYGFNGNVPENSFRSYADGGNAGEETFSSYRDQSNVGDDQFRSYGKNSNSQKVAFDNYGESFNLGSDNFTGYGQGATGQDIGFKKYGPGNNFKEYAKKGIDFSVYRNSTSESMAVASVGGGGERKSRWVEPGKFFRERMLKEGTVMPMPDIRDKMPPRSFLPRGILSKLPFASSRIGEIKKIFHAFDNSSMEGILTSALKECERAPSEGETKRCVGSIEDMVDFATSILGRSAEPRTTQSVNGSKADVLIGKVRGINGGRVTKSVSCHQSLYPYLLYYCHSVPKVRVYEADILDPKSKETINRGVAICHLDTSVWSPTHGAFLALGSGPGKIEVCHWIFENDLTWTIAD